MKIQKGEEDKETETKPKPIDASTPLKRLEEIYETEKETFLNTALTVNRTDLETATVLQTQIVKRYLKKC